MKTTTGKLAKVGMEFGGGGYVNPLSKLKALAIKKPLNLHQKWNYKVNKCNTLKELSNLWVNS
jgi:hypothetical protein|tara:strand:- start:580 stop:768 length:189 start_codon:yes stop_codon:yes gene_type:complete